MLVLGAAASPTSAQQVTPEIRADAIVARQTTAQLGVGAAVPAGTYLRAVAILAAGTDVDGSVTYRVDGVVRYHFDPFREHRTGPYAGGGVSFLRNGDDPRAWLTAFLGWEGPVHGRAVTAFEVGLGGGARIGVVLRRARPRQR